MPQGCRGINGSGSALRCAAEQQDVTYTWCSSHPGTNGAPVYLLFRVSSAECCKAQKGARPQVWAWLQIGEVGKSVKITSAFRSCRYHAGREMPALAFVRHQWNNFHNNIVLYKPNPSIFVHLNMSRGGNALLIYR